MQHAEQTMPPRVRRRRLVLLALALSLTACGGAASESRTRDSQRTAPPHPDELLACENALLEHADIDMDQAREELLVEIMQEAEQLAERCRPILLAASRGAMQRAAAHEQADQLLLQSYAAEAALSARFDDFAGYCEILSDMFGVLAASIARSRLALEEDAQDATTTRALRESLDLNLEALDVLMLEARGRCDD